MAILKIIEYPAEVLRTPAELVTDFGPSLKKLAHDMIDTMYAAKGVGLAGPQVGASKQIFVMDPTGSERQEAQVLINPVVLEKHGSVTGEEGCLSIPGYYGDVDRAEKIVLKAQSLNGELIRLELEDFPAIVAQHEIDHLNGILFVDYLSNLKRQRFEKEFGKDIYKMRKSS